MITMARSKGIAGPYESCPNNPVLTNRSLGLSIESIGHADMVQDQNGNWWAVCLGTRTFAYPPKHNLGRETMLVPVEWKSDWPVFGKNGRVEEEMETSCLPIAVTKIDRPEEYYEDTFTNPKLDMTWNFIYNPDDSLWSIGDGSLKLYGNEHTLSEADTVAWIGRRQQHHNSKTRVTLEFNPTRNGEEAGVTVFMNNRHHYEVALMMKEGVRKLIFRRQIGTLWKIENEMKWNEGEVTIVVESSKEREMYTFSYLLADGQEKLIGTGETAYLTTEVGGSFTGNYIALYASGNGNRCLAPAIFKNYRYSGNAMDRCR